MVCVSKQRTHAHARKGGMYANGNVKEVSGEPVWGGCRRRRGQVDEGAGQHGAILWPRGPVGRGSNRKGKGP